MIISVFDRVENIVGKGENAGYQHFLLFPQCFEKASFPDTSKGVIVWKWVNIDVAHHGDELIKPPFARARLEYYIDTVEGSFQLN